MARVELPQSKMRARRRRRFKRLAIVIVLAAVLVVGALAALAHAPFLRITNVVVTGAQTLSADTIAARVRSKLVGDYFFLFPKDNILLYPQLSTVRDLASAYPTIKTVDVHADNFHTVGVSIVERKPLALWCGTGENPGPCKYLDEDGVGYAPASDASTTYVVYLGAISNSPISDAAVQYLAPESFHTLIALVAALTQVEAGDPVRHVAVDDTGDVRAYFQNDFLLMFSSKDPSGDIFDRFKLALKADPLAGKSLGDIEYIDLRFGDKLYYKLKNAPAAAK